MTITISKEKLALLLAKAKAQKAATTTTTTTVISQPVPEIQMSGLGKHGEVITYNKEQQEFISLASKLESCILIGAAGTGKTTCMMGAINSMIHSGKIPIMQSVAHKYLQDNTHGIVACSFTRRAVANLRKAMPKGMETNCITIHKLLEYAPIKYEITDPATGDTKITMRFEPTRTAYRVLPEEIKAVIIDEASMVSVELFELLQAALPHNPAYIFLGDIQQLPPVFGSAILGFKMLELPTVELTQVYRQALESPIIKYATAIKDGETLHLPSKLTEETSKGKITFHPWKKKLHADVACLTFAKFITQALAAGAYNPETDCILIPFNKAFGTEEINKHIGNFLAKRNNKPVFEVIAGFNKHYYSVGDRVLYDKEDAVISAISINAQYLGKTPQPHSITLDYWGHNSNITETIQETNVDNVDFLLDQMAAMAGDEERVKSASHMITVTMIDSGEEITIDTASEINSLLLSYALTVHKAQGSEWDKVFLVLHQSHNTMIQRELLYTAVTRAAKELYIICEPESFVKGVQSQRIKGNTLAEKAEFFKGKLA